MDGFVGSFFLSFIPNVFREKKAPFVGFVSFVGEKNRRGRNAEA